MLIEKEITANDTYIAADDDADGYSSVTVNVSGGSSGSGEIGSIGILNFYCEGCNLGFEGIQTLSVNGDVVFRHEEGVWNCGIASGVDVSIEGLFQQDPFTPDYSGQVDGTIYGYDDNDDIVDQRAFNGFTNNEGHLTFTMPDCSFDDVSIVRSELVPSMHANLRLIYTEDSGSARNAYVSIVTPSGNRQTLDPPYVIESGTTCFVNNYIEQVWLEPAGGERVELVDYAMDIGWGFTMPSVDATLIVKSLDIVN